MAAANIAEALNKQQKFASSHNLQDFVSNDQLQSLLEDFFCGECTDSEGEGSSNVPTVELDSDADSEEENDLNTSPDVEVTEAIKAFQEGLRQEGRKDEANDPAARESTDQPYSTCLGPYADCRCSCTKGRPKRCIEQFEEEDITRYRLSCMELTKQEKELVIQGQMSSVISIDSKPAGCTDRTRSRLDFTFRNKPICRTFFMYLHAIGETQFKGVKMQLEDNGICIQPRTMRSGGRSKNALSFDDVKRVVQFIVNYAEQQALPVPGRVPGFNRKVVKILPMHETRASIHEKYSHACKDLGEGVRVVSETSFRKLWKQLLPYIVIAKPASDLCWTCQRNNLQSLYQGANLSEADKLALAAKQVDHLKQATAGRDFYRKCINESKSTAETEGFDAQGGGKLPCSVSAPMHYSFDYAQQVHYPSNPLQPGPVYFLTPRECGIFGVMCEGLPGRGRGGGRGRGKRHFSDTETDDSSDGFPDNSPRKPRGRGRGRKKAK